MTYQVRYISVSIDRPPAEVYSFVSNPENVPKWATGLGGSIKKVNGEWIADSPMGRVKIKFVEENKFGVLDHEVVLESGVTINNPMRVIANGKGSEIFFTLVRQPNVSDEKFTQDAEWVEKDLRILKGLLEKGLSSGY
jgi:carbon monoxide dehydrogenase subunit G